MTISRAGALILVTLLALLMIPSAALAQVEVSVTEDGIDPEPVVAEVGEAVRFVNDTDDALRLIDDDERWDSGELLSGQTFTITFNLGGVYTFTSEDGSITGTIEVGDAEAAQDEPTDEPMDEPADEAMDEPADEATDEPADEAVDEPTDEPADEAVDEPTDEPADEAVGGVDATTDDAEEVAGPQGLADTGLPSAQLAWLAALTTLAGFIVLHRTPQR